MSDRVDELVAMLTARLCLSPECSGDVSCEDCQDVAREALAELAAGRREAEAALVSACEIIASVATCTTTKGIPLTTYQWVMRFLAAGHAAAREATDREEGGDR